MKPTCGVNVAVSPETCQLPGMLGESRGIGLDGDTAASNVTLIGSVPLTFVALEPGETDTSFKGLAGAAVFTRERGLLSATLDADTDPGLPEPWEVAA
jgi:hypothetical protein